MVHIMGGTRVFIRTLNGREGQGRSDSRVLKQLIAELLFHSRCE